VERSKLIISASIALWYAEESLRQKNTLFENTNIFILEMFPSKVSLIKLSLTIKNDDFAPEI
jgi:hypothetical protein